ncbi:rhodanese-like domain-containing protein [Mariprofundus sp. KV]|uniref:rhodanese-like domain-containing protein n=1 Tax=Mariprofundus sp. KV TaxID=2608715 RepID=UPI0015A039BC|nr:rhodanese-like domain-containing protein [Mariprofundus sp. KV]NWF35961.1 hypothetical protein [Mariprofundus sp. KV]
MAKGLMDFAAEARLTVKEVSTADTQDSIAAGGVLLLDVREPGEVREGHLPGAINVPRGLLEAKADLNFPHREAQLQDRDQAVIVYCASGVRSLLAAATMQQMGFSNVQSMSGGFAAWKAEGRDIAGESW